MNRPLAGTCTGPADALRALLPPCVALSAALDMTGADVTEAERKSLGPVSPERLIEFAAGRWHLRKALAATGVSVKDLPRGTDLLPALPPGVVASITHVRGGQSPFVAAAAAQSAKVSALGIDAEYTAALSIDLWPRFLTPTELSELLGWPVPQRQARAAMRWCAKEAVTKAWHVRLDPLAIEVNFVAEACSEFEATSGSRVVFGKAATWRSWSMAAVVQTV